MFEPFFLSDIELSALGGRHAQRALLDELSKRCLIPQLFQFAVVWPRKSHVGATGSSRRRQIGPTLRTTPAE